MVRMGRSAKLNKETKESQFQRRPEMAAEAVTGEISYF